MIVPINCPVEKPVEKTIQELLERFVDVPSDLNCLIVGGAVRDTLLRQVHGGFLNKPLEIDWLVMNSSAQQLTELGFKSVGRDFPVFLHPQSQQEFALARKERKCGQGYGGFAFETTADISIEEDLQRRDLTINAMAIDRQGQIHDPYNGIEDLQRRFLKHVSPAFVEDPLRVFRVARFYAALAHLGFRVDKDTQQLMGQISASGELVHLSAERVWQETVKAMQTPSPYLYFQCLQRVGALTHWFAEVDALFGVAQKPYWHPEIDCGVHTLMVLKHAAKMNQLANDPLALMWGALTHDLGKAITPASILPSHHGHEQRGVELTRQLNQRLKVPRKIADQALLSTAWHTHFHDYLKLKPTTKLKVFDRLDAWRRPQRFEDLIRVSEADYLGRIGFEYAHTGHYQQWRDLLSKLSVIRAPKDLEAKEIPIYLQTQRLQVIRLYA